MDILADQVKTITQISTGLGKQLGDEKALLTDLNTNFDSSNTKVTGVMGRMDDLLSRASSSICVYICIFLIIFIVLLVKLT
jgi:hypothetical protein